ncbi:X-ray repair cross-complementing protein 5 isoform X1 [Schistocerca nitens]|uniref:X-ray repair cross-complementing protein 5 isoform X1 n=1 Tax=Schistocerca nitens TaxID=7011 RepID=UPI002119B2C0|nr:X-ray repair cross-complementing protein 5 isoform X1 [Schistocerca nitens]
MPRAAKVDAVIIVIDVGHFDSKNVIQKRSDFLQKAKLCVRRIVERRIFTSGKDEIGLIVLGSDKTQNPLDYPNVSVEFPLALPTWQMISFVEKSLHESEIKTDWIDGVVVGMQVLKDELEGKQFTTTTLVLISDCAGDVDDQHVDGIINELNSMKVSFVAIGPDLIPSDEVSYGDESKNLKIGQCTSGAVLAKIIDEVDGSIVCNFNDAIEHLLHLQKKSVKPTPWNIILEIGPDIRIPLSGYRKISEDTFPTWDRDSNSAMIVRETSYFLNPDADDEDNMATGEAVDEKDVCSAYFLGATIVPTSEVDEQAMSYSSPAKSLTVLCFTAAKNVPQYLFMGNGVLYFTLQNGRTEAGSAFSAVIQAMQNLDMVAVVRRVCQSNSEPYVGVLFPKIEDGFEYLVYTELPFAEDVRDDLILEPLDREINALTPEQLNVVDELIDSMDLMGALPNGTEAFKSDEITNITHHKLFSCISYRALHPGEKIPSMVEEIREFVTSPFVDSGHVNDIILKMKKTFDLKEVVRRRREKDSTDVKQAVTNGTESEKPKDFDQPGTSAMSSSQAAKPSGFLAHGRVKVVGTTNPESDFQELLSQGEPFSQAFNSMKSAIEKLVERSFSPQQYQKALSAVKTLRSKSVDIEPLLYNEWITQHKKMLKMLMKEEFWNMIVAAKLGLISSSESVRSSVSEKEANDFFSADVRESIKSEDDCFEDEDDLLMAL